MKKIILSLFVLFCAFAESSESYTRYIETVAYGEETKEGVRVQIVLSDGSEWSYTYPASIAARLQESEKKEVLIRNPGCHYCRSLKEIILIAEDGKGIKRDYHVLMAGDTKNGLPQILSITKTEVKPAGWFFGPENEYEVQLSDGSTWHLTNSRVYHFFVPGYFLPGYFTDKAVWDSEFQENVDSWEVGDYLLISPYENGHYLSLVPNNHKISTQPIFLG